MNNEIVLDVKGLKKDFDRFSADLPHLLEGATRAYGLTDLKVKKRESKETLTQESS